MELTRQSTTLMRPGSRSTPDEQRANEVEVYHRTPFEVQAYWAGGSNTPEDMAIVTSYYASQGKPVPPRPTLAEQTTEEAPVPTKVIRKKGSEPKVQDVVEVVVLGLSLLKPEEQEAIFRRLGNSLGYDVE